MKILIALPFVLCLAVVALAADDPKAAPKLVNRITNVDLKEEKGAALVVTATGEVPTGGYTKTSLQRVVYVTLPKDGIQDYKLMSTPPDGPAIQVISSVTAADTWKDFRKEAPWLKGVRIHGAGDGVMVKMLPEKK